MLYIERKGQGPNLILLHGWGLNSAVWGHALDELAKQFTVIAVDLPGHGQSAMPNGEYNLQTVTDQINEEINETGIWLGWSLGGTIALNLAVQHPEKVEKLVLVNSNAQFIRDSEWPHAMQGAVMEMFADGLELDYEATLNRFLMLQAKGDSNAKFTVRQMREKLFAHGRPHLDALRGGLNILRNARLKEALTKVQCPTLLMMGRLDVLVPSKAGEAMLAQLRNGQLHVFEHAAHAPFLSHADEFVDVLQKFING